MLPSDLTLSALRFILSAKSRQSCKQDYETANFCNSLLFVFVRSYCSAATQATPTVSMPASVACPVACLSSMV